MAALSATAKPATWSCKGEANVLKEVSVLIFDLFYISLNYVNLILELEIKNDF